MENRLAATFAAASRSRTARDLCRSVDLCSLRGDDSRRSDPVHGSLHPDDRESDVLPPDSRGARLQQSPFPVELDVVSPHFGGRKFRRRVYCDWLVALDASPHWALLGTLSPELEDHHGGIDGNGHRWICGAGSATQAASEKQTSRTNCGTQYRRPSATRTGTHARMRDSSRPLAEGSAATSESGVGGSVAARTHRWRLLFRRCATGRRPSGHLHWGCFRKGPYRFPADGQSAGSISRVCHTGSYAFRSVRQVECVCLRECGAG